MNCGYYLTLLIITGFYNHHSHSFTIKTIWAKPGQPITIPCDLKNGEDNNYHIEWRRNSQVVFNAEGTNDGHSISGLQGR